MDDTVVLLVEFAKVLLMPLDSALGRLRVTRSQGLPAVELPGPRRTETAAYVEVDLSGRSRRVSKDNTRKRPKMWPARATIMAVC